MPLLLRDDALDTWPDAFDLQEEVQVTPDALEYRYDTRAKNIVIVADVIQQGFGQEEVPTEAILGIEKATIPGINTHRAQIEPMRRSFSALYPLFMRHEALEPLHCPAQFRVVWPGIGAVLRWIEEVRRELQVVKCGHGEWGHRESSAV